MTQQNDSEFTHEYYMSQALQLASNGFPFTRPNPLVGSVIVYNEKVIASGFHNRFGGNHAEIEALKDAQTKQIDIETLSNSTLYVNLEPCCHTGKTPPCVDAIIKSGIQKVIIAMYDPNPLVSGKGVDILRTNGVDVKVGISESEARILNRRFIIFHEKKRPYVILKWAETADKFIARSDYSSKWISSEKSRELVHRWRDEEMAVMVGTNTAFFDNPNLTSRIPKGRNPIRVVIDRNQRIPTSFNIFDEQSRTILFNQIEDFDYSGASLVKIDFENQMLKQVLTYLYDQQIQSVMVEGGAKLLQTFIDESLFDEIRTFQSEKLFYEGIKAPNTKIKLIAQKTFIDQDKLYVGIV